MNNATRPLFSGDTDEAYRLATALAPAAPASPSEMNDAALREAINALRCSSALAYRERLAARLEFLYEAFKEESEGEVLSADCLRGFLLLLERAAFLPYPSVTLTSSGDIYASWRRGSDHVFSAHFRDDGHADYAVIYPHPQDRTVSDRASGSMTMTSLQELMSEFAVRDWTDQ